MPTRETHIALATRRRGAPVYVRPPKRSDTAQVLAAIRASRALHGAWVQPPSTAARLAAYLQRFAGPQSRHPAHASHVGLLLCRVEDDAPAGIFNLSEIVRGAFHSAYLGYYGLAPYAGQGYMGEGLALVMQVAFRKLLLHRVEANVQPGNVRSIALVQAAGFTREGYARRYLKLAGRWRDHERWALLSEDWRARQRPPR